MNMKQFDIDNEPKIEPGFKIPENYFEQFEAKIMKQVIEVSPKEVKVISIFAKNKYWLSAVAAVFVCTMGIVLFQNSNANNATESEELLAYEYLSTIEIAEHLTDNDIQEIEESLNTYDLETNNYIQENIY
ncbi:hypothetical protein [Flavobacterium sp.]|uniref:hypothetical protein n=1 Tax=Flavobacterium sp. TaxID=239 RepID=UPI00286E97E9|nr:hypothetical protein [Flavobacterium sp.]